MQQFALVCLYCTWVSIKWGSTVEPNFMDTHLIFMDTWLLRTFRLSCQKAYTFYLTFTTIYRDLLNIDNRLFSVTQVTRCHTKLMSLYGHFSATIVHYQYIFICNDCVPNKNPVRKLKLTSGESCVVFIRNTILSIITCQA